MEKRTADGTDLVAMFQAGAEAVEKELLTLNRLNVFPVPDADTGTNMLHTVKQAAAELARLNETERKDAATVATTFASGAFSGARGNSGVIFAELLSGFADALDHKPTLDGTSLANALAGAAARAYEAVARPVEGTMLTVIADVARSVSNDAASGAPVTPLSAILDTAVDAARDSVGRTPALLRTLRDHGVVDAGGLGVAIFLGGMRQGLPGTDSGADALARITGGGSGRAAPEGGSRLEYADDDRRDVYGYCTEFVVVGAGLSAARLRRRFDSLGESVVVAGSTGRLRVHIHTDDPGQALSVATSLGAVDDISIRNMDDQHRESVTRSSGSGVLVLVDGAGFAEIFASLGAMVREVDLTDTPALGAAVESTLAALGNDAPQIMVPNDPRIRDAMVDVIERRGLDATVIDAADPARGIAAMMAYAFGAGIPANVESMTRAAMATVVVSASRSDSCASAVRRGIERSDDRYSLATLYYGADVDHETAEVQARLIAQTDRIDSCEVLFGGQHDPHYLIALE